MATKVILLEDLQNGIIPMWKQVSLFRDKAKRYAYFIPPISDLVFFIVLVSFFLTKTRKGLQRKLELIPLFASGSDRKGSSRNRHIYLTKFDLHQLAFMNCISLKYSLSRLQPASVFLAQISMVYK